MLKLDVQLQVGDFALQPSFSAENELVVLFGPSGCGKSLTLQSIAGLLTPDAGRIELPGGRVAFDSDAHINMPSQDRSVGYVVQELALFPHMTARQNIEFPLAGWTRTRRTDRVANLVSLLDLEGLEERKPRQLSGGQQQRVALARALAAEPSLLLLDEPFSALDASLRSVLRREVAALRRRLDVTALFVTHDLSEAYALADRIVVMDGGRVLQQGTRATVLDAPASRRVAELTEVRNMIPGEVVAFAERTTIVRTPWFRASLSRQPAPPTRNVFVCIRPEYVLLVRDGHEPRNPGDALVEGTVVEDQPLGNTHRLVVSVKAEDSETGAPLTLEVDVPAHPYQLLGVSTRANWRLVLTAEHMTLVPRENS
jgi:molybdate transport system ATP-binding protein